MWSWDKYVEICAIKGFLSNFEVWLCFNNGSPCNNLFISTISRGDVGTGPHRPAGSSSYLSRAWVQYYVLHIFCPIFLINFGCLSLIYLLLQLPLMLVSQHRCGRDMSNIKVLGTMLHCLKHEQIVAMSSSDRLTRVCGESITWSSTSFMVIVWLNPSLRKFLPISLMIIGVGLLQLGCILPMMLSQPHPLPSVCWLQSKTFCPLLHHGCHHLDIQGPLVCLGCCHPPHDELMRFVLLVILNLFSFPSYVKGV